MTLALGLGATFIGAAFTIAGYKGWALTPLLFGRWGEGASSTPPNAKTAPTPGNASNGGVYKPTVPPIDTPGGGDFR